MENPFGNVARDVNSPNPLLTREGFITGDGSGLSHGERVKKLPSEPSLDKGGQGEFTLNDLPPSVESQIVKPSFNKGGNDRVGREEEGIFQTRRADLSPAARNYADRLHARIQGICSRYGVSSVSELHAKIASGEKPSGLQPGDLKSDSAELSKLADRLQGLLERKGFAPGEEFEAKKETLHENERAKLSKFFGREIEVPPLPEEITLERMGRWETLGLELHYLPPIDMAKETELKNWAKPDFKNIDPSQLPPDAMLLPGRWVLADGRGKPKYGRNGNQNYGNDEGFLGPVLETLREKGLIEKFRHPRSRFNVSPEELEKPEVVAAIAEAMGLANPNREFPNPDPQASVSLPRMIEFNVLGNVHHPEWCEPPSDCGELFADKYRAGQRRLNGGYSADGGFACVHWDLPDVRREDVGFRPLGRFS